MRVIAIIQARVGSTRLPRKVLADIEGRPMLWYVVQRVRLAQRVDAVVVATPNTRADLEIDSHCRAWGVSCFSGPEKDVLARYVEVALHCGSPDYVVRITADCPLIDPRLIDAAIDVALERQASYVANIYPTRDMPDGLDVEVIAWSTLTWLDRVARGIDREHVTTLLRPAVMNGGVTGLGHLRWTVDTAADLAFVREVYRQLAPRLDFSWHDVLALGPIAQRSVA